MATGRRICLLLVVFSAMLLQQQGSDAVSPDMWETDDMWREDMLAGWEAEEEKSDVRGAMSPYDLHLMLERVLAPAVGVGDVGEAVRKLMYGAQSGHVMRDMMRRLEEWMDQLQSPSTDQLDKLDQLNQLYAILQMLNRLQDESSDTAEEEGEPESYTQKGRGPERNQTGGYLGCKLDYSQLVRPLLARIAVPVYSLVYSTVQSVCASVCARPGPCPICTKLASLPFPPSLNASSGYTDWAIDIIDTLGKPPTGLVEGKLHWIGSYEMCEEIAVQYNYTNFTYVEPREFLGKYCRLTFDIPVDGGNATLPLPFLVGICVPDTCSKEDVAAYIDETFLLGVVAENVLGFNLSHVYCGQQDYLDFETDYGIQALIGVLLSLFIIVVIVGIYDALIRPRILAKKVRVYPGQETELNKTLQDVNVYLDQPPSAAERVEVFIVGFSGFSNALRLFGKMDRSSDEWSCVHGIRTLSTWYSLIGCTYLLGPIYNECWLPANIIPFVTTAPREFAFQLVINSHFYSDSFLLLSGLMVTYKWMKKYSEHKLTFGGVLYYIFHSYWKLFPAVLFTLFFYTFIWQWAGAGPTYPVVVGDATNCRTNWWVDLLMLHNLINRDFFCLTWTWLMPLMFQLWIFSLIILIPLAIKPVIGYALLAISYIVHISVTAAITSESYRQFGQGIADYFFTPWCRAGPYFIGMALALVIRKYEGRLRLHWMSIAVGWIVSLTLIVTMTFITYDQFKEGGQLWGQSATAAYYTLSRQAWAVGVGWIVFVCRLGYGGAVNAFLGWGAWRPFSLLSLGTLLLYAPMVYVYMYGQYTAVYIDFYNMIYVFLGHIWITTAGGFLVAMFVQYPFSLGLERAFHCRTKRDVLLAGRSHLTYEKEKQKIQ